MISGSQPFTQVKGFPCIQGGEGSEGFETPITVSLVETLPDYFSEREANPAALARRRLIRAASCPPCGSYTKWSGNSA